LIPLPDPLVTRLSFHERIEIITKEVNGSVGDALLQEN